MKKNSFIIIALACLAPAFLTGKASAQDNNDNKAFQVMVRAGYSLGGTAPLGIPATIRSIDAFRPTASVMAGIDLQWNPGQWGVLAGVHFENKGMDAEVTTKGYRMEVVKGDSKIEGLFTGHVEQDVTEWMVTVPVQLTCQLGRVVTLKAGPYISLLIDKDFSGIASDGYLRQGDPTGPRINMGNKEGEWATYDFSNEMRNVQMGLAVGADWRLTRHFGLSSDISWGLTGIFNGDFKTVEQTLYPIYGTVGAYWRF